MSRARLFIEGVAISEPGFKAVFIIATELVKDHVAKTIILHKDNSL